MRKIWFQKKPPIVYSVYLTKNAKTKGAKMIDIVVLLCSIDDFWMTFKSKWEKTLLSQGKQPPKRRPSLFESEIMTIAGEIYEKHLTPNAFNKFLLS